MSLTNTSATTRGRINANAILRDLKEAEETILRLENENTRLEFENAGVKTKGYAPIFASFMYEGARRTVKLLGRINDQTLQCFDFKAGRAGRVKNYSLNKIYDVMLIAEPSTAPSPNTSQLPNSLKAPSDFISRLNLPNWY